MRALIIGCAAVAVMAAGSPAYAAPGDILIKVRGGYVLHPGSSRVTIDVDDTTVTAKPKAAIGGEASLTFFMTDHIATEIGFGVTSYDLKDGAGRTLSSAGLITPSATLQYHLLPDSKFFRPYVGVGVAYANFYSEKAGEILTDRDNPFTQSYSTHLKGGLAPVAQVGADIALNDQFYVNVDAKYLGSNSKFRVEDGGSQTFSHEMRSVIIGAGVGFRF
ncbi:OmpW/AlkL family protein [Rhizorhapis sp. SPR117]|uniref:OmpW/AlkL family protein n=1 Tax=Rhizorhapis sp. SPR117 TaxID=2912611 RepID=UPI002351904D